MLKNKANLAGIALWYLGVGLSMMWLLAWWLAALGPLWGASQWGITLKFNYLYEAILEGVLLHAIVVSQLAYSIWWLTKGMKGKV